MGKYFFPGVFFLVLAMLVGVGALYGQERSATSSQVAQSVEHSVAFGENSSARVNLPKGFNSSPIDPHGSKGRSGLQFSHPDAKGLTVSLIVSRTTGEDHQLAPDEALRKIVTKFEDTRRAGPEAVSKYQVGYQKGTVAAAGEVTASIVAAPGHISWTEMRAIEVTSVNGNRYLIQLSIDGFKAGVNKERPTDGAVQEQLASWQQILSPGVVSEVLKSLQIVGMEVKPCQQVAG